jgi:hypothetical protein
LRFSAAVFRRPARLTRFGCGDVGLVATAGFCLIACRSFSSCRRFSLSPRAASSASVSLLHAAPPPPTDPMAGNIVHDATAAWRWLHPPVHHNAPGVLDAWGDHLG